MQQRPHDVVRVDAADALDHPAGHRLPVGHDRERLERSGRQPNSVEARVPRDQRPGLGCGRQLDTVAGGHQADTAPEERHLEVPEAGIDLVRAGAGQGRQLAARERPLGHEEQRLELEDAHSGGRVGAGRAFVDTGLEGSGLDGVRQFVARHDATPSPSTGGATRAPPSERRDRQTIGPHGSSCSIATSRLLHEFEHREERHRDDDPIAYSAQQVLEHDQPGAARSAPRMTAARSSIVTTRGIDLRRRRGLGASRSDAASETRKQPGIERRLLRRARTRLRRRRWPTPLPGGTVTPLASRAPSATAASR